MKAEEKRIANEMYLAGESPKNIGAKLHYSPATVRRYLSPEHKRSGYRVHEIAYPGLAKWFVSSRMTLKEFTDKLGASSSCNVSLMLRGKYNPSKGTIDKILAVTGLTYEEAFSLAKDDANG